MPAKGRHMWMLQERNSAETLPADRSQATSMSGDNTPYLPTPRRPNRRRNRNLITCLAFTFCLSLFKVAHCKHSGTSQRIHSASRAGEKLETQKDGGLALRRNAHKRGARAWLRAFRPTALPPTGGLAVDPRALPPYPGINGFSSSFRSQFKCLPLREVLANNRLPFNSLPLHPVRFQNRTLHFSLLQPIRCLSV